MYNVSEGHGQATLTLGHDETLRASRRLVATEIAAASGAEPLLSNLGEQQDIHAVPHGFVDVALNAEARQQVKLAIQVVDLHNSKYIVNKSLRRMCSSARTSN